MLIIYITYCGTPIEELGGEAMGDLVAGSMLFPNLPDDLSVQCIARVPRSSHPSLLLVSRSWRSLLRSRRLFSLRADLGVTEPSLCVCITSVCSDSSSRCYFVNFLNLRPCSLLRLPPPPFPAFRASCAVLGSSLYLLGGSDPRTGIPSSAVQIFDPCLNRWAIGPPMADAREFPVSSMFQGRIYVFRRSARESGVWADVLDPESGVWASLPWGPNSSSLFRGQYLLNHGSLLDPMFTQLPATLLKAQMVSWEGPAAVLDGVLYAYNYRGKIRGFDPTAAVWKTVQRVQLGRYVHDCAQLTNVGGLLCLVWVERITNEEREMEPSRPLREIHCVGVEITRTGSGGFRGSIAYHEALGMPIPSLQLSNSVVLEF